MRGLRPPHHRGRSSSGPNATAWPICFRPACPGTRPCPSRRDTGRTRLRTGTRPAGCAPEGLTEAHQAAAPAIQQALQPPFQGVQQRPVLLGAPQTRSRDRNDGRSEYWSPRTAPSSGTAPACRDGTVLFAGPRTIAPASADVIAGVMAGCRRLGRRRAACAKAPPYSGPLAGSFGLRGRRQHHCAQPRGQLIADTRTHSAEMPA